MPTSKARAVRAAALGMMCSPGRRRRDREAGECREHHRPGHRMHKDPEERESLVFERLKQ